MNDLAQAVIEKAIANSHMLATAESCTGGLIAAALTDIAGSSASFDRGFVTYSNEAKAELLGVPLEHTVDPGAVSELVALEMVTGALARSNANLAVAVTGIAGPGGGTDEKPVGLVYIAVQKQGQKAKVSECKFATSHRAKNRKEVRDLTVQTALDMLLQEMT